MKQIIHTGVVVFVDILLLMAMFVTPHHHHGDAPCFDSEHSKHCCTTEKTHQHHCTFPDKDRHASSEGNCPLDQFVALSNAISQLTAPSPDYQFILPTYIQAIFQETFYDFSLPGKDIHLRKPPFLINLHSIDASLTMGLRAPPVA